MCRDTKDLNVSDRISAFQEDEFVKDALEKGMDLRQYALQVEDEMQEMQSEYENDCKYKDDKMQNRGWF